MPSNDPTLSYTRSAKIFHAISAILVLINLGWGLHMEHFPGYKHGQSDWNGLLFYHASLGALIFWLTVVRLLWRARNPPPQQPASMPTWQKIAVWLVHGVLYLILFLLPLTGYVHRMAGNHPVSFFGLFDWPTLIAPSEALRLLTDKLHVALAFALIALLVLHLAAVVKHTFVDRDGILRRMF